MCAGSRTPTTGATAPEGLAHRANTKREPDSIAVRLEASVRTAG